MEDHLEEFHNEREIISSIYADSFEQLSDGAYVVTIDPHPDPLVADLSSGRHRHPLHVAVRVSPPASPPDAALRYPHPDAPLPSFSCIASQTYVIFL